MWFVDGLNSYDTITGQGKRVFDLSIWQKCVGMNQWEINVFSSKASNQFSNGKIQIIYSFKLLSINDGTPMGSKGLEDQ